MAAPTITGARGTGNTLAAQQKPDIGRMVLELEPNEYPLTVLTKNLSKRATHNADFSWFEDDLEPRTDTINGTTGTGVAQTVSNGSRFAEHDLWRNLRTSEVVRVQAVAGNNLTLVRGVGGSAVAINNGDPLVKVGSAQPEGDRSKPARSGVPTQITNYCQITRTSVEHTETQIHTDEWTEPADQQRIIAKKGIEHAREIEGSFLFGRPSKDTSGAHPRRTTGGVLHYITTNITDASTTEAALTQAEFFNFLSSGFRYGSKTKTLLASRTLVNVINNYALGKVQINQSESTFGIRVFKVISPHGDVNLIVHDALEGTTLGGYGILLDMKQLDYRYLANSKGSRDTDLLRERQENDEDTDKSEYLTEAGLQMGLEKTHALLTTVTV